MPTSSHPLPVSIDRPRHRIEPSRGWPKLNMGELWEYRELLFFLTWRDVKVRYKQTVLGAAWAILQPLVTVFVFGIFFGRVAKMPSDGLPYTLFSFAGLVPWTFFATGMNTSSMSLVASSNLLTKVYFPRLAIPIAATLAAAADFCVAFLALLLMMAVYRVRPTVTIATLPLLFGLVYATALGTGLWLAATNVRFRDVKFLTPFLTQVWLFATPIVYPSSLLHEPWRTLYAINPMVGVVDGFRWALFARGEFPATTLAISTSAALVLLTSGLFVFRRMERTFADYV